MSRKLKEPFMMSGTVVPEIVGDAGSYASRDSQDVVKQIRNLYEDSKLREALINAGQERALQYTRQACVERLESALEACS